MYGFDKPIVERFFLMMKNYLVFDFGESFFRNRRVVDLVLDKMPVSISLGLWTTLLVYLVSIPLGIAQGGARRLALRRLSTSAILVVLNAIPGFLFAVLLIVLFAGGSYCRSGSRCAAWSPTTGRSSSLVDKVLDYFWHMALPIIAMTIGGFTTLTFLTKNSFLEEINKQYVLTARAKGLIERRVLYGHVFRNAMLIVDRRLPGGVHRRAVHRLAADRGDLLARRPRPARLRGGAQPRLSGDVRHALFLRR